MKRLLLIGVVMSTGLGAQALVEKCDIDSMKLAIEKSVEKRLESYSWKENSSYRPVAGQVRFHSREFLKGSCGGLCKEGPFFKNVELDTMYAQVLGQNSEQPLTRLQLVASTLVYKSQGGDVIALSDSTEPYAYQFRIFNPIVSVVRDSTGKAITKKCVTAIPTGSLVGFDEVVKHQVDFKVPYKVEGFWGAVHNALGAKYRGISKRSTAGGLGYKGFIFENMSKGGIVENEIAFPDLIAEEMPLEKGE
jgi:hypothetical protein